MEEDTEIRFMLNDALEDNKKLKSEVECLNKVNQSLKDEIIRYTNRLEHYLNQISKCSVEGCASHTFKDDKMYIGVTCFHHRFYCVKIPIIRFK